MALGWPGRMGTAGRAERNRYYIKTSIFAVLGWYFLACGSAFANPSLIMSGSTIIGVAGVQVGATTYSPMFVDGTCAAVYGACDPAHFTFGGANTSDTTAVVAAETALKTALLDLGATDHNVYAGCSGTLCEPLIPWYSISSTNVWTSSLYVTGGDIYGPDPNFSANPLVDSTGNAGRVWVQWVSTATQVPEPTTLSVLGVALLSLVRLRRGQGGRKRC